jgi:tellurite resistance protein TehA-like permease
MGRVAGELRRVDAGAFAFVMATGILSVAAWLERIGALSDALLALACAAWVVLAAVVLERARHHRAARLQSFAAVAATSVLGARVALSGEFDLALGFLLLATAVWVVLLAQRPSLAPAVGGSLLFVVATESLGVLAALLAPHFGDRFLLVAATAWALGLLAYPVVVVAIARRRPQFAPDLWILMGALAIATVAGAELLAGARVLGVAGPLRQPLRFADLALWVAASALIVPLALADLRGRATWTYSGARWSFAFPAAMYVVATDALGAAAKIEALTRIGHALFYVALACWVVVFAGLVRRVLVLGTARRDQPVAS